MNENDKDWLACAIDGEGTISISKRGDIQIAVYNTNKEYVEKAARLMDCSIYPLKYRTNKIIWSAYVCKRMKVLKIIKTIESKLIIKKEKAKEVSDILLSYFEIKDIII
ncbi:MAG: hypothetical protein Q7R49_00590 [Candidatus Daviesbacteria bacterium]|nr:hypothetical protein [Candidatus Daviesbacteria bacterium]